MVDEVEVEASTKAIEQRQVKNADISIEDTVDIGKSADSITQRIFARNT